MTHDANDWLAEVSLEVPFHDVDMMGVAWHGNYAKYLEAARTRLFEQIQFDYEAMKASGYAWPVIEMHIRYPQPIHYGQRIRVTAQIVEYESRLRIDYVIRDAASGQRLTRAHTVQVALDMAAGELCFVSPEVLFDKLGVARP